MRIIAFITDTPAIRQILDHIGEPSTPPPLATARGPPGGDSEETSQEDFDLGIPSGRSAARLRARPKRFMVTGVSGVRRP